MAVYELTLGISPQLNFSIEPYSRPLSGNKRRDYFQNSPGQGRLLLIITNPNLSILARHGVFLAQLAVVPAWLKTFRVETKFERWRSRKYG